MVHQPSERDRALDMVKRTVWAREGPDKQAGPAAHTISGRTFSAVTCCTIRAEWTWMA